MTDADKLERIRSIVRDHDAYGLSRHHEMLLDITDVLGLERFSAAEQRVLDAMAAVPEDTLRRSLANALHAPEHSRAPCAAELARRGLKP